MKINSMSIANFRSHQATSLELDRLNFIVGLNRSGKSSIAMAIEWLLTGICDVTDERGAGADDLVRLGAKQCEVSAKIDLDETSAVITRSKDRAGMTVSVTQGKNTFNGAAAREWMQGNLPPAAVLSAVLNASRFIDLDAASQKRLVSQVLADNGVPVPENMRGAIDLVVRAIRLDGAPFLGVDGMVLKDLDRLHKAAYELRTQLGRDLKALGNPEEPADAAAADPEKIKKQLATLRDERDRSIAGRAALLREFEDSAGTRTRLEARILEVSAGIVPMEEEKKLKPAREKAAGLEAAQKQAANVRGSIENRNRELQGLAKLGESTGCPTCHRPLKKAEVEEIARVMNGHITTLKGQLQRAEAEVLACNEAAALRDRLTRSIQAVAQKEEFDASLRELPDTGQAPDTTAADEAILVLDGRIAKGEDVLVKASAVREQLRQFKEAQTRRESIEKDLETAEKVIAFAGPDGARKEAAGDKLVPFTELMNEALAGFDFAVEISLEPFGFQIFEVDGTAKGKPRTIAQLSESERFRFSVAFQIALAGVTGIRLAVVDRADVLDKFARNQLAGILLASNLDQAIVCATRESLPESVPDAVRFFEIGNEEGSSRVLNILGNSEEAAA